MKTACNAARMEGTARLALELMADGKRLGELGERTFQRGSQVGIGSRRSGTRRRGRGEQHSSRVARIRC